MRVLQLLKTSHGGPWAVRQMRELVRQGVEVHVALPPGGVAVERCREWGVQVHLCETDFPIRHPWRAPRVLDSLRGLVRELDPALVHSHFVGTTLSLRLALGRNHPLPRIFQVPGPLHLEHALFRKMELATAGPADHWIATCRKSLEIYRRSGVPRDRTFLSYYGFDVDDYDHVDPGGLRARLNIAPTERIVGMMALMYRPKWYLGQRRGLKGHEDLIDALALCRQKRPGVVGVFAGGAFGRGAESYEARVRAYAKKRCGDAALLLGTRKDVRELYAIMDVAVHPSHSENLGGAVESFLMRVPTIATNIGGFPDLVRPAETGWLVPARDPKRLAEAILEVLENLPRARELARRGRLLTRAFCESRRCAGQVLQIYRHLLAPNRQAFPCLEDTATVSPQRR